MQGIFVGSGVTDREVYFSYKANWSSPGRWGVELVTSKHRIYLRPLEKLFIQKLNSLEIEPYELNDEIDVKFKPGIFLQTEAFLEGQKDIRLKTIEDQVKDIEMVEKMKKGSNDE